MLKRCFFDGTNSLFYCKQMTYRSSNASNWRTFGAKLTQIEAKKRPKIALFSPSKRGLGAVKALAGARWGARRASNWPLRTLEIRRGQRLAPGRVAGFSKCYEVSDALHCGDALME